MKSEKFNSLKELIQDSTIHGIPRIIKSKRVFMKMIWTVCFLASTGYCSYIVIDTINDYLKYDYVTSIDNFYEIPAKFPSISFCNLNVFQTQQSQKFLNSYFENQYTKNLTQGMKYFHLINYVSNFSETFKKSLAYPLDQVLIDCEFNLKKCNSTDFQWVFDPFYGNCFKFNSGKETVSISNTGLEFGLRLELFLDGALYTQDIFRYNGYRIRIGNATMNYLNISDRGDFNISPGMCTDVSISRYFNYRLEYPYNDCKSNLDSIDAYDSDLFRLIVSSNYTYNQMDCFYMCFQKIISKKCNCSLRAYGILMNHICTTDDEISCSSIEWNSFIKSDIFKKCSPDCPKECDSFEYSQTLSLSEFPSRAYYESTLKNDPIIRSKYENKTLSYESVKSNVLALNVYYTQLGFTVTSQQSKTTASDLVSNVGGILGLFLGVSFLSVVEIVEFIFEFICLSLSTSKLDVLE